ncbi:aldehyde dehydrogenase family protein [Methylophaga sp.]|jgi:acyl-CoA reductase-like NAD-dependent aldehyde dehydrogenase|uniref:aldehyde dehydrogenase family protein n=1 Tax=Methylophaga sp. TaxID=2024840 RepID=UPI00140075FC|nr:aldehyde dehydrogenase family protein [Methylophaga sp.]MTI63074.1 aldehyde dehydrogenase family protein [Methylophaga sp.]
MSNIPHFPLMIAGLSKSDADKAEVYSPYNDQLIGTVDQANQADIDQALDTAYGLFRDRSKWLSTVERIEILEKAIAMMKDQAELLAVGAAEEGGKPLADSNVEMARCIDSLRACVDVLRNDAPATVPMGINPASQHRLTMMRKEPIGVVVAISAFNHPLNLIAHQVGPAIASGCPVIVKPAEKTPLSCYRLVEIFHRAGLPPEWCQALLTQDHHLAEYLATDSRVAFLSFIGSARVGWHLRSKLAPGARCALEHGGVAPVIVAEDANLDTALPGLAKGSFYHAGQVCVSVQRIYAERSVARELAEKLADAADKMTVGDPLSDKTDVGPIINKSELNRIASWVQEAVDKGGELLCGGQTLPFNCYAPTVLFDPPATAKVSNEEVFGPVVCVYPVDDIEQAINKANGLEFAFQASVYSRNIDTAMLAADRLDASAVMINEHTAFRVDWMPFAGLKHSGLGTGGVPYTMHDMQIEKMIVLTSKGIH